MVSTTCLIGKQLEDTVDMLLTTTVCFPANEHTLVSILLRCTVKQYIDQNCSLQMMLIKHGIKYPSRKRKERKKERMAIKKELFQSLYSLFTL